MTGMPKCSYGTCGIPVEFPLELTCVEASKWYNHGFLLPYLLHLPAKFIGGYQAEIQSPTVVVTSHLSVLFG
jgi:hypothetical protein